jgi:hypothetical protein
MSSSWMKIQTPLSVQNLEYSPSIAPLSESQSLYVDKTFLHHPSIKSWTPSPSFDSSGDHNSAGIAGISSQILGQNKPLELDSFGSAEEMCTYRDGQSATREYSIRQTYSFLNEMADPNLVEPLSRPSQRKTSTSTTHSRTTTSLPDFTWSRPTKVSENPSTKSPKTIRPPVNPARRAALDKNKAAAARCRTNKNSQINHLRDSARTVIAANTHLRQEVMDRMQEIQFLQTEVLYHTVDTICKNPHEIRDFLRKEEQSDVMDDTQE